MHKLLNLFASLMNAAEAAVVTGACIQLLYKGSRLVRVVTGELACFVSLLLMAQSWVSLLGAARISTVVTNIIQ